MLTGFAYCSSSASYWPLRASFFVLLSWLRTHPVEYHVHQTPLLPQSCDCCTNATPWLTSLSRRAAWPPPAMRTSWTSSHRASISGLLWRWAPLTTCWSTSPSVRNMPGSEVASPNCAVLWYWGRLPPFELDVHGTNIFGHVLWSLKRLLKPKNVQFSCHTSKIHTPFVETRTLWLELNVTHTSHNKWPKIQTDTNALE